MKKNRLVVAIATVALAVSTHAATVEMSWGDPAEFRDFRVIEANKKRSQERIIKELSQQFVTEAAKLPAGQVLKIAVNDLDLAGEIEYFHWRYPFGLRVIRNVDFPRISLQYELRDANANVVKSGTADIADLGFRNGLLRTQNNSSLRYEKALISDWYSAEF